MLRATIRLGVSISLSSAPHLAYYEDANPSISSLDDITLSVINPVYGYSQIPTVESIHPHRLALLFGILSLASLQKVGCGLRDLSAKRYYILACSAISLAPIISEASCATIQAIFTCHTFLHSSDRGASEENWLLSGIMSRLAYRVRSYGCSQ